MYTKIYGNVSDRLRKGEIMCIDQLAMMCAYGGRNDCKRHVESA